jgi:predicted secreted Zn-dependent protease
MFSRIYNFATFFCALRSSYPKLQVVYVLQHLQQAAIGILREREIYQDFSTKELDSSCLRLNL